MPGIARVLTIAGSDSGGGAGIQADLKTITMLGGHALTAITAVTAQNSTGVTDIHRVPSQLVIAQMDAVAQDFGVDAVKIGMIGSSEAALYVADWLEERPELPVVFDPVMVASSGAILADPQTIAGFSRLMRRASVTTPNLAELEALGGEAGLRALCPALLIKGGHGDQHRLVDRLVLADGREQRWTGQRIETRHSHGTGCTLASAIATGLGQGMDLADAVARARLFVRLALREAPGIGAGHGPMGHGAVRLDGVAPVRLNQMTLAVSDYARSVSFYRALGFTQIVDAPENSYARFEAPGGLTLSIEAGHPLAGPSPVHLYLECASIEAVANTLAKAGLTLSSAPIDQPWRWREARLQDPDGHHILLYTAGENRRFPPWRL